MARFTGTIGNPSVDASGNKIVKPIGEPIDIVFYAKGKAPIIRKTAADGKYDFTLANGSYQVSMYLSALPEAFRIRADLRDGEFFVVATNSPTSAFQEWIDTAVDANKPEDNPIVKHIQGQLDAMQVILDQFRDETSFAGDLNGKIMREGAYGFGGGAPHTGDGNVEDLAELLGPKTSFFVNNHDENFILNSYGIQFVNGRNTDYRGFLSFGWTASQISEMSFVSILPGGRVYTAKILNDRNTTIDSNGFLKAASPIIKLFDDRIETNGQFKEEPVFEKIGVGTYKISNTLGLAKEGWYIDTPKDKNGLPYFMVDWEQDEETYDVIIRVFKKKLDLETLDFINGDPIDIGEDQRWIDLRFHEEPQQEAEMLAEMEGAREI